MARDEQTRAEVRRAVQPLARRLAKLEQQSERTRRGRRASQLPFSSIEDGSLAVNDAEGNETIRVGRDEDGNHVVRATNGGKVMADVTSDGRFIGNQNSTYVQDVEPTVPEGGHRAGDLWILPGEGGARHFWDGTAWQPLPVGGAALAALLVLATRIVAGDPAAERVELNESGLFAYSPLGMPSWQLAVGLPTFLALLKAGETVASVSEFGDASFASVAADEVREGGSTVAERIADEVASRPRGLASGFKASRVPNASGIVSEYGILGADFVTDADAVSRSHRYTLAMGIKPEAAGHDYTVRIRYTTDGSLPTITSPVWLTLSDVAGNAQPLPFVATDITQAFFANDTYYRFLVTLESTTSGMAVGTSGGTALAIEDVGPRGANVGYKNTGGGVLGGGGSDTGTDTQAEPVTKTYTYEATWHRVWEGANAIANPPEQGNNSYSRLGNLKTMIGNYRRSNGRRPDQDFATTPKVEVFLNAAEWVNNDGGTIVLGFHTNDSPPGDWVNVNIDQGRLRQNSKSGGKWYDISDLGAEAWAGGRRGITLGPGPTNANEFAGVFFGPGAAPAKRPKVRITGTLR